jgi:2-polyprenyl-6-methoxyphenol hydroxylase-like FAD-dependent oxidoreductase
VARILVLGGGFCGLAAGLLLARDGHEVTVLERDFDPVPTSAEEAWEQWPREGVTQFRQAHFLAAGGRAVLEETLPDVLDGLVAAGACRFDPIETLPPTLTDRARQLGDERFVTFTARRPVMEQVLGAIAQRESGLEVRRGASVAALIMHSRAGVPHVSGARLKTGESMSADIVVDAMGRRSQLPRWLKDAGVGPIEEEAEDSGFIYYGRYFRSLDGSIPQTYAPLLTPIGTFSILTLPGDNGTWAVGVVTASGDKPLKQLRNSDLWTAVLRSCPLHSHWLDGEPMSEMLAMGGLVDRYRRLFVDGAPLITGVALLADAYSCTNPSLGRGISLGLMHARSLRDTVAGLEEDPVEFAQAWDSATEDELTPWYRETLDEDRAGLGEMEALREGQELPPLSEASALRDAVIRAGMNDADLFRTYLDSRMCLARLGDAFSDPTAVARVFELADQQSRLPFPGPDRSELLHLLA